MFMWLREYSLQGIWELVSDQLVAGSAQAQLCLLFKFDSSDLAEQQVDLCLCICMACQVVQ